MGWDRGGTGFRRDRAGDGLQKRWDTGWDAGRMGRMGCSRYGTRAGQDVGRWTMGRTGCIAHPVCTQPRAGQ